MVSRRLEKNFGHRCSTDNDRIELKNKIPYFAVNEINPQVNKCCQSQQVLDDERKYHSKTNPYKIHPLSSFRNIWEIFMIVISLILIIYVPFTSAFFFLPHLYHLNLRSEILQLILQIFCWFDIIINFQTGFYNKQRVLKLKFTEVAKNYMKTSFFFDLLSSLPSLYFHSLVEDVNKVDYNKFIINIAFAYMKIFRLVSFSIYINRLAQRLKFPNYYVKMTLLTISILIIFHWATCLSIVISGLSAKLYFNPTPLKRAWIIHNNLWKSSIILIYTKAFFRISALEASEEITNTENYSNEDHMFIYSVWISSKISSVLVISFLSQLTRPMYSSNTKYKEDLINLMEFMKQKPLTWHTRNRIIKYHEFRFQRKFFNELDILNSIPSQLRQEIYQFKCLQLIEYVPFFKDLPKSLLIQIASRLQQEIYLVNDIIYSVKMKGKSLYFICFGTVAVYSSNGVELYHLCDGDHFGEIEILRSSQERIQTVIATEPSELYRLDYNDLKKFCHFHPDLADQMKAVAAERMVKIISYERKYNYFKRSDLNKSTLL